MALRAIRHLDLALLVVALPVFIAAKWPIGGWVAGAGIYVAQWGVRELTTRRAARADDPRQVVGLLAGSMVGRGFAVAIGLLLVGLLGSNSAGLAAAVLFLAAFTIAFVIGLAFRPLDERTGP